MADWSEGLPASFSQGASGGGVGVCGGGYVWLVDFEGSYMVRYVERDGKRGKGDPCKVGLR